MHKNAFKLSAVRPTMTSGGLTSVLISSNTLTNPHRRLNFFIREASLIFIAFAERTRKITEILGGMEENKERLERKIIVFSLMPFVTLSLTTNN